MAHIRTQIRQRFKTILDGALPVEYNVFSSRKSTWNHKSDGVLIDMRFLNDQTQEREVMGNERVHVASLYIRIQRSADEAILDDQLDSDQLLVEAAVNAADFSDLLEEVPELLQVNSADDADGGYTLGALVLRYDVEYRIDRNDPETPIQ